jgi:hypothetical protein
MKHHRPRFRNHFRPRRPAPPQPTRSQIAQSLRRLRALSIIEFDLAKACDDSTRQYLALSRVEAFDEILNKLGRA